MKGHPVTSTLCDICTYFEVATSNSLRGDAFSRNVTEARMDGRMTDRLWYEIDIFFFFSYRKSGYNQLMLYYTAMDAILLTRIVIHSYRKHGGSSRSHVIAKGNTVGPA